MGNRSWQQYPLITNLVSFTPAPSWRSFVLSAIEGVYDCRLHHAELGVETLSYSWRPLLKLLNEWQVSVSFMDRLND